MVCNEKEKEIYWHELVSRSRQGILQRDNMPFQTYVDRGYFRVVESKWNAPNGDVKVNYKTVVYQKGIEYISKVLRDLGYERIGEILN